MASWIDSANASECPFPIQNLPYGVFSREGEAARCGVAIGDKIIDLAALADAGLLDLDQIPSPSSLFSAPSWNGFMALGQEAWSALRTRLIDLLSENGDPALKGDTDLQAKSVIDQAEAALHLPIKVAEYTDFYAGRQHAFNVGTMFRGPENALPPNWLHIPIGYNGRASTVVVSGTDVIRPVGQTKAPDADSPGFGPCKRLDIELEMGAIVGMSSEMGQPMSVQEADDAIFGYVLLNDWSARDIQAWEYQPLGPFQAKAFATTISPWIVTKAALEPFRTATPEREKDLLPYLSEPGPMLYDIDLEVRMQPKGSAQETTISRTNYKTMYYSAAQQLAHHSVSGCKMNTGDLLGSGTISGPTKDAYGSLLEITWGGKEPLALDGGETRTFLEDGDRMDLTGWAQGDGYRIGFGTCSGTIQPARKFPSL